MPAFVTSYLAQSATTGDTSTLVTPSFTPASGELIVVKAATWDGGTASGTPSGGSLTYTRKSTAAPAGFFGYCTIFTATVGSTPGAMTVTLSAPAGSCYHSMVVERWTGAQVAATPATNTVTSGAGTTPSAAITTTASNSIITWVSVDENSNDPTGRIYLSSATEDGLADGHLQSDTVQYYAYQTAGSAGTQTIGMSAPSNQQWAMTGIEILAQGTQPTTNPSGAFLPFF
jgi:hypothetical protein